MRVGPPDVLISAADPRRLFLVLVPADITQRLGASDVSWQTALYNCRQYIHYVYS